MITHELKDVAKQHKSINDVDTEMLQLKLHQGIPTALTNARLPKLLLFLIALRLLLISFFGGRWCSLAQMGFSLERLTRPRKTTVTNLFIIAPRLLWSQHGIFTPFQTEL